jgi:MFS family permease
METEKNQIEPKSRASSYFYYVVIMMGLVHIVDVLVSNVATLVKTAALHTFFEITDAESLQTAQGTMGLIGMIGLVVVVFQPLVKTGTDRWGRKPMLIISVLGMSLGNVGIGLSAIIENVWLYALSGAISFYFLAADLQLLIIAEESPKRNRSFWVLFMIFIGNFSTLLVPFAKGIFISDDYSTNNWHYMYFIGAGLGVILAIIIAFTIKESKAYITAKEAGELKIRSGNRFSLITAIKDLRSSDSWKAWRSYILVGAILTVIPLIIFSGYTETNLSAYGYPESVKNKILYVRIPLAVVWIAFSGWLADKIGRKPVLIIDQFLYITGLIMFLIFIRLGSSFVLIGISWGMMFGGTYGFMNLNVLATNEILPTKLRASSQGVGSMLSLFSAIFPSILFNVLLNMGIVTYDILFFVGIPFTIAVILIVIFKYKETKGIVLEDIKEITIQEDNIEEN